MRALRTTVQLFRETITSFLEDDCLTMAAALAFYAIFSIPPLFVIAIAVTGWLLQGQGGEAVLEEHVRTELSALFGERGRDQVLDMVDAASQPGGSWPAAISGVIFLCIAATGVVVQLQLALNRIWDVEPDREQTGVRGLLLKRVLSFAMVIGVAFLLLVSLALSTMLARVTDQLHEVIPRGLLLWLQSANHFGVTALIATLLLAALFKWLPDVRMSWRTVWLGAIVTAGLSLLGKELLGWYFGSKDPDMYGGAGPLALLLLWTYYSSIILLFGAELTHAWARSRKHVASPAPGVVRVTRQKLIERGSGPPGAPWPPPGAEDHSRPAKK